MNPYILFCNWDIYGLLVVRIPFTLIVEATFKSKVVDYKYLNSSVLGKLCLNNKDKNLIHNIHLTDT